MRGDGAESRAQDPGKAGSVRGWKRQHRFFPGAPDGSTALGSQTSACRTERMSVLFGPQFVELLQQRQDLIPNFIPSLCPSLVPMAPVHSDTTFNRALLF